MSTNLGGKGKFEKNNPRMRSIKNSIVQLDPWLWCSKYEHLS